MLPFQHGGHITKDLFSVPSVMSDASYSELMESYVVKSQLPLWYQANETSGTTAINYGDQGATLDGTITNVTLDQTGLDDGGCWDFVPASTPRVVVPNHASINALSAYTWMFYFAARSAGTLNAGRFVAWGNVSDYVLTSAPDDLVAEDDFSVTDAIKGTNSQGWTATEKRLLFLTLENKVLTWYRGTSSGVVDISIVGTDGDGTITAQGDDLVVGNRASLDRPIDALVGELALFNVVLTLSQMRALTAALDRAVSL